MNSPKPKKQTPEREGSRAPPVNKAPSADEQNQATTEDFDEEGMGVAPKE